MQPICLTQMTMKSKSSDFCQSIKLDLSVAEHHLLWDIYNKINHGRDSAKLSKRLLRGLGIESESNPPLLAVRNWSTHRIEQRCILLAQKFKMIFNQNR